MADPTAPPGAVAFADAWATAIAGTSYLPMEHAELIEFLARFVTRIRELLRADALDVTAGQTLGAELVQAHIASPEALGRTIEVMCNRLLADLDLPGEQHRDRLVSLIAAMATGYTRALRDRTLDEQSAIRRAAFTARQRAEEALRESEARFRHQANHDPLTSLPNRTLFQQRMNDLFTANPRPHQRVGLCYLDLDGFKQINDTLGHYMGDLLLTAVADRLRQRLGNHLVARWGGDEFVILVEGTDSVADATKVAEQALAAVARRIRVGGHDLSIGATVGVVEAAVTETDPKQLLQDADLTLNWAKSTCRGRWAVFDPARKQEQLARYELSIDLAGALDQEEFFLEYQPIVNLRDGTVQAVEALVRWRHPTRGVLMPREFLDLAEETELILRLGEWTLTEACRQARAWDALTDQPPLVSVNLAPRQVRDSGLIDLVTQALEEAQLPPHRLQLEIVEDTSISRGEEPLRTLRRLVTMGVRLAIDDFGTGYSNLAYLRRIPAQELKLAGLFTGGLPQGDLLSTSQVNERIMSTLITLAHELGLTVTAEMVETQAQAQQLQELGCDFGQGWYFGPPVPPDQLAERLIRR